MRNKRLLYRFLSSRIGLPLSFFTFYLLAAGTLVLIFEANSNKQFADLVDGVWWAIITVSTTGYGDKFPITLAGRLVAIVTILIGIGGMSFLSGTLASVFVERNTRARRGLMDFKNLKEHIVICGWKNQMREFLLDVLSINPGLAASDIVIVSNVAPEKVENLKEEKQLRGLLFVRGDYFSEPALRRANVPTARKVVVLADTLESGPPSEVDSKTVMTVLTIRALAKDIYICAELLDKKFENYLREAMCDEVVFSRDFNRMIIASASAMNGVFKILYQFIGQDGSGSRLTTEDIGEQFVGGSYGDFRRALPPADGRLLLGVLENTGSPHRMKVDFLRQAQKTSDVSRLVSNLQTVKGLIANHPVLLPGDDYVVQKYSRAIFLERSGVPERTAAHV